MFYIITPPGIPEEYLSFIYSYFTNTLTVCTCSLAKTRTK